MTEEKFFKMFPYSFYDGGAYHPVLKGSDLDIVICSCPPSGPIEDPADIETRYLHLLFTNIRDFSIWDDDKLYVAPLTLDDMWIPVSDEDIGRVLSEFFPHYINWGDFSDGKVVFEECMCFVCDDIVILEARELREDDG